MAAAILLMSTALVAGMWIILLRGLSQPFGFVKYAFSPKNEYRWSFVLVTEWGLISLLLGAVVVFTRRRAILRSVLVACAVQTVLFGVTGGWLFALYAALPAWALYKAQHEV